MTFNCILSKVKYACDLVKLKLLENYCLPSLTYSIECGIFDNCQLASMNSWWNSVYRKIFGYFKWESVRNLICSLNKLNFTYIEHLRRIIFIKKIMSCHVLSNSTLYKVTENYVCRGDFYSVLMKCNIDMSWPISKIVYCVHQAFKNTCG